MVMVKMNIEFNMALMSVQIMIMIIMKNEIYGHPIIDYMIIHFWNS